MRLERYTEARFHLSGTCTVVAKVFSLHEGGNENHS